MGNNFCCEDTEAASSAPGELEMAPIKKTEPSKPKGSESKIKKSTPSKIKKVMKKKEQSLD